MSGDSGGSVAALVDAQFTVTRILRPIPNFVEVYQGQDARRPLMWTEQGNDLDPLAAKGEPGYAPNLIAATSVPVGSRVIILFPSLAWIAETSEPYTWDITWRLRTVRDTRLTRGQYHLPKQGRGAPDTTGPVPEPRVYIPGITQSITYNQSEPASVLERVYQNVISESYRIGRSTYDLNNLPLLKDGTDGVYEQGVIDPAVDPGDIGAPSYMPMEFQALGDELMIGMRRETAEPNWDFSDPALLDGPVAKALTDAQDSGVLVMTGTAP